MKLYELQDQLVQIDNILEANTDSESQEILESAKEEILKAIDGKINSICEYINDCKTTIDKLKDREEHLYKKRKSLENKTVYLKGLLLWWMKTNNKQKETFGDFDVSVCKTPDKIIITDDGETFLPDDLCNITRTPNKTAIKDKLGEDGVLSIVIDGKLIVLARKEKGTDTIRIK